MPNSCPSGGRLLLKALWVRIEKFGAANDGGHHSGNPN
jgi:hypothetical protein